MTKADFAREIKEEYGIPLNRSLEVIDIFTGTLYKLLSQGETVGFKDFGKFHVITTKPKIGRILSTNVAMPIPERKAIKFVPSKKLKDAVEKNGGT